MRRFSVCRSPEEIPPSWKNASVCQKTFSTHVLALPPPWKDDGGKCRKVIGMDWNFDASEKKKERRYSSSSLMDETSLSLFFLMESLCKEEIAANMSTGAVIQLCVSCLRPSILFILSLRQGQLGQCADRSEEDARSSSGEPFLHLASSSSSSTT